MNLAKIKDIRWKRVIDYVLEETPNRIIDIGCSSGNIFSFLVNRDFKVLELILCLIIFVMLGIKE